MEFEPVIGLEIHAQLKTKTKIFCGCSTAFGAPPNTHVCPVCLGMPGVLPVLNRKVVDYALRMAVALGCRVERKSRFARKNYFYPDLPKGYQISQYELPIAVDGHVEIEVNGDTHPIGITRIHMEEDAGKLVHHPTRPVSMVDYNRTGVPLIEIVSEPDIRSAEAAGAYLRHLRSIVRYLEICDGNLEEGSFRCDANVSIRPKEQTAFGTRTELKNLNSFRFVEKAIRYEINRQKEVLLDGGMIVQETRLWDEEKSRTFSMRGKEEAHDYRYFPDPDLLPLVIDDPWLADITDCMPELPDVKKKRFVEALKLPEEDARILTSDHELAAYFETCLETFPKAKPVSNWILSTLLGTLKAEGKAISDSPVPAHDLAGLLTLVDSETISGKIAKTVFEEMVKTGKPADIIVKEKGLKQVTDASAIETVVAEILETNPGQVEQYRNGKTKVLGFFVGQAMKATRGKANPKIVNEVLKKMLGG